MKHTGDYELDTINMLEQECSDLEEENKRLEEENKNLKEKIELLDNENMCLNAEIKDREEENKKLKEKIEKMEHGSSLVFDDVERICNEKMALEEENQKLKSDLSECECSFGFESDEVGFWKGEYKRLKKWIKDHCKGYGNLFPEDEMKRQWKKADKKRKKSDLYKDVCLMEEDTLQELRDIGEI